MRRWDTRVDVMFQPKAWVDADVAQRWVLKCATKFLNTGKKNLVFMDNLNAQTSHTFKRLMNKTCNAYCYYFVPGCTDVQQPIDQGVGAILKRCLGDELDSWLMKPENLEQWVSPKGLPLSERRVLMTKWMGDAWFTMNKTYNFEQLFEKTGCLMSVKGCDVNFTGHTDYKFAPATSIACSSQVNMDEISDISCDLEDHEDDDISENDNESLSEDSADDGEEVDEDMDVSDDDDVADAGPFVLNNEMKHSFTMKDTIDDDFYSSMATRKVIIAHKFDFTGWDIGKIVGVQTNGKSKGFFIVKYESDNTRYYHKLPLDKYGPDKLWVALIKK